VLADVLAAVAVLALGLTALVSSIPVSGAAVSEGSQLTTATFLAAARLEEARAAAWSASPAVDRLGISAHLGAEPRVSGIPTFSDESPLAAPYGRFSRDVRISDCAAAPGCAGVVSPSLRQITVRVSYRPVGAAGVASTDKTISLTTFVTQR
jgi:hypothetical protein